MKLIAMLGAGALAIGAIAATPATAQRWDGHRGQGYDHGGGGGWHGRDHYRGGYRGGGGYYRGGYGYRGGGYGYRGGYRGGYGRVVCRMHRGYYGPVRTCFRR